jgi:hypothetical protein
MPRFKTYSAEESRSRKASRKVRKQSIKMSTERKEVSNDTSYLESILGSKTKAR